MQYSQIVVKKYNEKYNKNIIRTTQNDALQFNTMGRDTIGY